MTDPARRICDELGVCREESIFYLEGFDWDLDAAMEACRSKTLNLPSLTVESPPEKEKASPEIPSTTDSKSRNELIAQFYNLAVGSDTQDATSYLERNDWDLQRAVSQFLEERRSTPSQRKLNQKLGRLDLLAAAATLELMREEVPKVSSNLKIQESTSPVKESAEALSSSMSLIQLTNSPEEELSRLKEEIIKSFRDVVIVASRKAAKACLSHCKWNQEDAISYFFGDYIIANPEIAWSQADAFDEDSSTESLEEAGGGHFPEAKAHVKERSSPTQTREDSRTSSNQLQNLQEQPSQSKDDLIDIFIQAADGVVTRDVATVYLTIRNWNVDQAFSDLIEEEKITQVQDSEEGETGSSSSSSNADSIGTGNLAVAIPGVEESCQVDENVKDKAVDEDLGTELSPVPVTTTMELEINLDDGESGTLVLILVRSDQTVRDIHNRIDAFRPEDNRDYYLKSDTGVEYRDLDATVHRITSGSRGSTTLHQVYST